ncbi:MAG: PaaI family thioesterase [Clostridia bacterium]|nr:PaaI family thioesterase [Clostridia bacterium]
MTDLEKAKEFFTADRYATELTGIEIVAVGDRYAKCRLETSGIHQNAVGHVMGGVFFTLADFTFAVAANHNATAPTVTVTSTISYLTVPSDNVLLAEAHVLRDGKRNCFYEIRITDGQENLVATVNTTGAHLS